MLSVIAYFSTYVSKRFATVTLNMNGKWPNRLTYSRVPGPHADFQYYHVLFRVAIVDVGIIGPTRT